MNRATSNRRLLKLAAFLAALPPKRFNYEHWVGEDWKGAKDLSCGTTACALGWAASMPEFRRLGLGLRRDYYEDIYISLRGKEDLSSEEAGAVVFGVTYEEAGYLFWPECLPPDERFQERSPKRSATPKQVAAHIRQFVTRRDRVLV